MEKIFKNLIKTKQMITARHEGFKYQNCIIRVCQKKKMGFVKMNLVNVIAMKDQVLEEAMRGDNIVRKTVQP